MLNLLGGNVFSMCGCNEVFCVKVKKRWADTETVGGYGLIRIRIRLYAETDFRIRQKRIRIIRIRFWVKTDPDFHPDVRFFSSRNTLPNIQNTIHNTLK